MDRNHWLSLLSRWADVLRNAPDRSDIVRMAGDRNPWFGPAQVEEALTGITEGLLEPVCLQSWLAAYPSLDLTMDQPIDQPIDQQIDQPIDQQMDQPIPLPLHQPFAPKTIGLVLAGNLPLVGFHDALCVLVAGHHAQIKVSAKDPVLLPWALDLLLNLEPALAGHWKFVERLQHYHAVIATGSDNSNRYFLHYFKHVPHLLRGNRSSAAILRGDESTDELQALGRDIFQYFGLGCRSVSHLFVSPKVELTVLLDALEPFAPLLEHSRYRHNFDYQRTLLLLNRTPHLGSDFLSLVENSSLVSPISVLHYTRFQTQGELDALMERHRDGLQVLVGRGKGLVPFGRAQQPGPADYADQKDTLAFLANCF